MERDNDKILELLKILKANRDEIEGSDQIIETIEDVVDRQILSNEERYKKAYKKKRLLKLSESTIPISVNISTHFSIRSVL